MIPFSPPFIDQQVIDSVVESLKSGWITTGPKVKALEEEVSSFVGVRNTLCVNSATSGLMQVMRWFGVKVGDEVIIPSYTYAATALAVYHLGAKPIMVDVNEDFNISVEAIKNAITSKTKVIIPVDIAGWPCDYEDIISVVEDSKNIFLAESKEQKLLNRILVLSDAAHSIGASYKGKKSGALADITVFSFHAVKNVTTAEGGAICINLPKPFNHQAIYDYLRLLSLNGQTKDAFTKTKAGAWRYDIAFPGFKVNMPDICAAIGLEQIKKYEGNLIKERERVALAYQKAFTNYSWTQLPPLQNEDKKSSFHIYPLRIKSITEEQRDLMIQEISNLGVAVNVHFVPLPMLTAFKNMGYKIENHPIAYHLYSREISLPIYPQLTDNMIAEVVDAVVSSYQKIVG